MGSKGSKISQAESSWSLNCWHIDPLRLVKFEWINMLFFILSAKSPQEPWFRQTPVRSIVFTKIMCLNFIFVKNTPLMHLIQINIFN